MCSVYRRLVNDGFYPLYSTQLNGFSIAVVLKRLSNVINDLPTYNRIKKELLKDDIVIFQRDNDYVLYRNEFTLVI